MVAHSNEPTENYHLTLQFRSAQQRYTLCAACTAVEKVVIQMCVYSVYVTRYVCAHVCILFYPYYINSEKNW